jgi:hypothetical protein
MAEYGTDLMCRCDYFSIYIYISNENDHNYQRYVHHRYHHHHYHHDHIRHHGYRLYYYISKYTVTAMF